MSEPAPKQNLALQHGGGTAIGVGAGLGGTLGVIVTWLAEAAGVSMPAEVGAAFGSLLSVVAQVALTYVVSDS